MRAVTLDPYVLGDTQNTYLESSMIKATGHPVPAETPAATVGVAFSLATAMARSTAAFTASVAMANSGLEKRFNMVSPLCRGARGRGGRGWAGGGGG